MSMPFDTDTLIIGASAAGLATATCLKQAKLSFEILEKLARRIVREVPGVVSVTYNIAPKPPSTMEAV